MMRACVHIVALAAALAACRANPGFQLRGDGEETGASSDTGASSEAGSTAPELCEPAPDEAYPVCEPKFPLLPLADFNVARSVIFANNDVCGVFTSMLVRRAGDTLQRCDAACDDSCSTTFAMDVSFAAKIELLAPLLPDEGECAVMWHVSREDPDPEADDPCTTAGFLLMDDTPEQALRVQVVFDSETPDPFAGQPGAPLRMTSVGDFTGCDLGPEDTCVTDYFTESLHLSFGACELDTHQSVITTQLRVAGNDYTLETHNAFRCLDNVTKNYRWWVRREF